MVDSNLALSLDRVAIANAWYFNGDMKSEALFLLKIKTKQCLKILVSESEGKHYVKRSN